MSLTDFEFESLAHFFWTIKFSCDLTSVRAFFSRKNNKNKQTKSRILGECPSYLTQMLIRNTDVNGKTSRHGQLNRVCPRFKWESEGGKSFSVWTSHLWNMMPAHIKNQPNLTSFKKSIFKHLWTVIRNWTILSCKFLIFQFSSLNC